MNAGFLAEGSGMLGIDIRMSSAGRQFLTRITSYLRDMERKMTFKELCANSHL